MWDTWASSRYLEAVSDEDPYCRIRDAAGRGGRGAPSAQRPTAQVGYRSPRVRHVGAAAGRPVPLRQRQVARRRPRFRPTGRCTARSSSSRTRPSAISRCSSKSWPAIRTRSRDRPRSRSATSTRASRMRPASTQLGASPLRPRLAEIQAIKTTTELAEVLGRLSMIGLAGRGRRLHRGRRRRSDEGRAVPRPGRHGAARPRLLPRRQPEVRRDPAEVPGLSHERVHARRPAERRGGREGGARPRDRAREDPVDAGREPRRRQDLQQDGDRRRSPPTSPASTGWPGRRVQGIDKAPEWVISQPSFFKGFAAMVPYDAARHVEGVDGGAAHHAAGAEPVRSRSATPPSTSSAGR